MSELMERLPEGGGWTVLAVIVLLVLGPISLFSKETAQSKFGALGAAARWVRSRRRRAIEEAAATEAVTVSMLNSQIKTINEAFERQDAAHRKDVAALSRRFERYREESERREMRLAIQLEIAMDYIAWASSWARTIVMWAAQNGYTLPPPEWQTFRQWQDEHQGADTSKRDVGEQTGREA